jgi:hypothetical protein
MKHFESSDRWKNSKTLTKSAIALSSVKAIKSHTVNV